VEGARKGAGLGDQFLRHIERTRVLVHLLDVGALLQEGSDLLRDYETIRKELGSYRSDLLERAELIALNKIDLIPDRDLLDEVEQTLRTHGHQVFRVSGATGEGIDEVAWAMLHALDAASETAAPTANDDAGTHR
jgi:GTP-binding protein